MKSGEPTKNYTSAYLAGSHGNLMYLSSTDRTTAKRRNPPQRLPPRRLVEIKVSGELPGHLANFGAFRKFLKQGQ